MPLVPDVVPHDVGRFVQSCSTAFALYKQPAIAVVHYVLRAACQSTAGLQPQKGRGKTPTRDTVRATPNVAMGT